MIFPGISLFLKEIASGYRFLYRTRKAEKAIIFYAEHAGYYPYLEGLITELTGRHGQTLCYVTSDPDDPVFQKSIPGIKPFYFNKLLPFLMAFLSCRLFVMTLTDLNQFHLRRSVNNVHYVYVFHALLSTHMVYRYGAFDHYDSILCCGPHHVTEIRKHERASKLEPKILVEAGYYRLERIYQAYRNYSPARSSQGTGKTVLIAPSWGVANTLETYGELLTEVLLEAGYNVIVRPHPETVRRSPDLMTLFSSRFGGNLKFTLETSVITDDSLLRADVLICDISGIALEYAFGTERPVLFLDVPLKIHNPRFRELEIEPLELTLRSEIGVVVSLDKIEAIPRAVASLMENRALYQRRIAELRKQNIYAFGHSSEIGAQHIIDMAARRGTN
ncbi:MAG: hypothetical protein IIB13_03715 [Chloroflexi bacterium]|nr:hypothetical protein [Chloroflexota bacterium]